MFFKKAPKIEYTSEIRDVPPFVSVMIKGGYEIELKAGTEKSRVTVTADGVVLPYVKTYVKDGVLYLENEPGKAFLDASRISMKIECETIREIFLKGAADMHVFDVDTDRLELNLFGAGNINADNIKTKETEVSLKGGSNVGISGVTDTVTIDQAGAGNVDVKNFKAKNASITMGGAGRADIYATDLAVVEIRGVGAVNVHGRPENVKRSVLGIGTVNVV